MNTVNVEMMCAHKVQQSLFLVWGFVEVEQLIQTECNTIQHVRFISTSIYSYV